MVVVIAVAERVVNGQRKRVEHLRALQRANDRNEPDRMFLRKEST